LGVGPPAPEAKIGLADASRLAQKVRELGELLRSLPDARRRAFQDALDAIGACGSDERKPIKVCRTTYSSGSDTSG
jgi:hypothetical protein